MKLIRHLLRKLLRKESHRIVAEEVDTEVIHQQIDNPKLRVEK